MADTASIAINILADGTQLEAGLKKAETSVGNFAREAMKFLGPAAVLGAAVAVTRAFLSLSESMDEIGKSADRLGLATEELLGLQHAAEQSGASLGALERGIINLQKNTAKAAQGSKTLGSAFSLLNIELDTFRALNTDQQLKAIADGLEGIENPAQRNAVAFEVMGKAGIDLIKTFEGGADALIAMQEEAAELGITMDRETIAKFEEFNDTIDRVSKRFRGMVQTMLAGLLPMARGFAAVAEGIAKDYQRAFGMMTGGMDSILTVIKTLLNFMDRAGLAVVAFMDLFRTGMELVGKTLVLAFVSAFNEIMQRMPDRLKKFLGFEPIEGPDLAPVIRRMKFAMGELKRAFDTDAGGFMGDTFFDAAVAPSGFGGTVIPGMPPPEVIEEEAKKAGTKAAKAAKNAARKELAEADDPFTAWFKRVTDTFTIQLQLAVRLIDSFAKGIGDAFADAVTGTKSFGEAVKQLGLDMLRQIISTLAQVLVTALITSALVAAGWVPAATLASIATLGSAVPTGIGAMTAAGFGQGGGGGGGGSSSPAPVTVNNNVGANIGVAQSSSGLTVNVDSARDAVAQDFSDSLSAGSGVYADAIQRFNR